MKRRVACLIPGAALIALYVLAHADGAATSGTVVYLVLGIAVAACSLIPRRLAETKALRAIGRVAVYGIALPLAGAVLVMGALALLTGCGAAPAHQANERADAAANARAAVAYVRAHPVPHRRHMVAGIAVSEYSDPGTGNWSQTVITASGRSLTVSCGNPATQVRCSWDGPDPYLAGTGVLGSYEYVRADGTASRPGSIRVIKKEAV